MRARGRSDSRTAQCDARAGTTYAVRARQRFLEAGKRGDRAVMEPLLRAEGAALLEYNGKGCTLGFIGHTAQHWAAAKKYHDHTL